MPTYILLSKLTPAGRKSVRENPKRIKEVNREIKGWDVKVLKQYSLLGPYDFLNIVEAPNDEAITRVSIELGFRGTLEIMSLPAMEIDDFIALINNRERKRIEDKK